MWIVIGDGSDEVGVSGDVGGCVLAWGGVGDVANVCGVPLIAL